MAQEIEVRPNNTDRQLVAQQLGSYYDEAEQPRLWIETKDRRAKKWYSRVRAAIDRRLTAVSSGQSVGEADQVKYSGDRIERILRTRIDMDPFHPEVVEVLEHRPDLCAVICATYLEQGYHIRLTQIRLNDADAVSIRSREPNSTCGIFYLIGIGENNVPPPPNFFSDVQHIDIANR